MDTDALPAALAEATERHRDAVLALSFTAQSIHNARGTFTEATREELHTLDRLAAEAGETRLEADRLRHRLNDPTLCPRCGKPYGDDFPDFSHPVEARCLVQAPRVLGDVTVREAPGAMAGAERAFRRQHISGRDHRGER